MKPDRIILLRHGQSEGNLNKEIYKKTPDYALRLTKLGHQQAIATGKLLMPIIGHNPIQFYVSPFWRTRETFLEIATGIDPKYVNYYEDPRLREQEWGQNLVMETGVNWDAERARNIYGHFYFRFPDGESCADVFDRMSDFLNTLFRDFEKPDFPRNVVIVTHGMAMRCFLMRFFKVSVEEFESWGNPKNCEYLLLERGEGEKYNLLTPMKLHKPTHDYQFSQKINGEVKCWIDDFIGPKVPYINP